MTEPGHDGNAPAIRRNEHSIPRLPVNRNFSRRQNPFHARFRGIGSGDTGRSMQKSGGHYAGILRHRRREVISQHTHMHFPATENSWQSGNNRNFRGRNMSLPAARQALTTGIQRFSGNVRIFLRGHRSPHLRRAERQIRSLRNTWSCQLHPERSPKLPGWGSIKRTGTVGGSPAYAETVGE